MVGIAEMNEVKKQYLGFRDLECWKACREVRLNVETLVKKFPADEKYQLTGQIRRASRSACANIAEGYGRFHFKENIQFCRIGRGSLYETSDHLEVAMENGYITDLEFREAQNLVEKASSILNGYINYLQKQQTKD